MSHDASAGVTRAQERPVRGKYWWLRWAILAVVAVVLAVEVGLVWDQLAKAWVSLYSANWWWVLAAVGAAMASMHFFGDIQRKLLRSAGVPVREWRSQAAFYAGNSLSTTLPGGPVLSATFIYRQQRMWGATPMIASWQLVMSGALQVISLTLLGLGSAFFLGAKHNPFSLIFTFAGFILLIVLAQAVASRPDLLDGVGVRVLSWVNYLRAKPSDNGLGKWRDILGQLEAVKLSRSQLSVAFVWSMMTLVTGVATLLFACYGAGGSPSLLGVIVAYVAARAAGSIPLMPGGLLVVEAVLVPGLVSSGMTLAAAISAMLIYRLISWIYIAAIGWLVFFFMFRLDKDVDPDMDPGTDPDSDPHGAPRAPEQP